MPVFYENLNISLICSIYYFSIYFNPSLSGTITNTEFYYSIISSISLKNMFPFTQTCIFSPFKNRLCLLQIFFKTMLIIWGPNHSPGLVFASLQMLWRLKIASESSRKLSIKFKKDWSFCGVCINSLSIFMCLLIA